jgi:hypothetical protein
MPNQVARMTIPQIMTLLVERKTTKRMTMSELAAWRAQREAI